ncbi:MAG: VOC family protein, partial [Armatimonadetes bacterium]|nr:VOC family protein [Anaerolineae bacterium]
MTILGLHHITIVASDAQRTVDFYSDVLGLRFVKQTVNFDDPSAYHLYFGDETGAPGTAVTFFEWRDAPKGKPGIGGTHHFALTVNTRDGLLKWKRYLTDKGIAVRGIYDRVYFQSLYLNDPDGMTVEIATKGPGWAVDEAPDALGSALIQPPTALTVKHRDEAELASEIWTEAVPVITDDMALRQGMHHITAISANIERTHTFFGDLLGMRRLKMTVNFDDPTSQHWYWGAENGAPGTLITYFERTSANSLPARMGAGQTHHFALAVADEDEQLRWREKLIKAGYRVSPVMDRIYFKSIYTNDPDGHIVELATLAPGFLIDEPVATLGSTLQLPPWLEPQRPQITRGLKPLV